MSKIEDALNLVKDVQGGLSEEYFSRNRIMQGSRLRRRPPRENLGAEWISNLNSIETSAPGNPESRVILGAQHDERVIAAYKMLRTRTLHRMRRNNWHVIGVTSPTQGDGKSLTALNLAISLAKEETLSVVMIELDLRRPSVCSHLGVDPARGLPDYLEGSAELESVLFRPEGSERLAVLPNTEVYQNSSEALGTPKLADLIDKLRGEEEGRVVICDLPPFLVTDDVLAFSPLADAFLVVLSEGTTSRDVLKKGVDILQDLPILGVVLNRSEEATAGYYY
jgi:Mrp family chromosome partitioning ATPase